MAVMDPVTCDTCADEFVPNLTETRVKGGARQRFGCPHCSRVYDVAFITTTGLKLRPELQRARQRGDIDEVHRLQAIFEAEVSPAR